MENILLKYMTERMNEEKSSKREPGPVITLSREYGCYASRIAEILSQRLSQLSQKDKKAVKWQVVSNEILEEAAKKLEVEPLKISHIFGADEKKFLGDIIESFSTKKYASDSNIKKTITSIVDSYAEQGHVIIVGRAGCVIAKNIPKSLHVRLTAPFDWRVRRINERFQNGEIAARKQVVEIDEKRKLFMGFFKGHKPDSELFDVVFNRAKMTEEEIVESILLLAKSRNIV